MLKNYLTTALRSLRKQPLYTGINVLGLTLGITCCLLIFQYVAYETSFDDFHTKKDRLFRTTIHQIRNGEDRGVHPLVGYVFGPTMQQEVPGIARYTRLHPYYGHAVVAHEEGGATRAFTEDGLLFADSTALNLFSFTLIEGDRARALHEPGTMLVSASMARKYFGADTPVGKTLTVTGDWVTNAYTVAGVFEDVSATSHLQFDALLPMEDLLADGRFDVAPWGWSNFITYVELEPSADADTVAARITAAYRHHRHEDFAANNRVETVHLQPLPDIHLGDEIHEPAAASSRQTVRFFGVIGLITLLIALVNYVNLATARAMDRAKEVGVRKTIGARRGQLVGQFLMESALLSGLALGLAVAFAWMLLPAVNEIAGVEMSHDLWVDARFWVAFLGVFIAGTVLAGLYPAVVLSAFEPVTVLKGATRTRSSGTMLRKVLVVTQFAASIALLAGTAVVYAQLHYMRTLDTGLDLEQVLVVEGPRVRVDGTDRAAEMEALKNELRKLPTVQDVGLSSTTPGQGLMWYTTLYQATAAPSTAQSAGATLIDAGFAPVYGLEVVAGEGFYDGFAVPDSGARQVVINEALVRALGFASNEEALDARITSGGDDPGYVVRGVFEDFQWSSAHQEVEAVMFGYEPRRGNLSMKVNTRDLPGTMAAVREQYEAVFPGNPFNYHFADAAFDEQYRSDQRFAALFGTFTGIALFIACLGLFGLASFMAARRTKEIGVRKVLGASVPDVLVLLGRDFVVLVGVAFLIAAPVAYVYLADWLTGFAYRIDLGPGLFALTGTLTLAIALLTVSYQAIKAALADPVKSLRYE